MELLHILADPKPTEESAAKQIASAFFSKLSELQPNLNITNVDLYENPPPYLSNTGYRGSWYPSYVSGYQATEEELAATEYGSQQSDLFNQSDVLVLTAPLWSFSLPAILKSWMDQVLLPGKTYLLERSGPSPLHRLQKLLLFTESDDTYKENDPRDALTVQIRAAFDYIGVDDLSVAWADGQSPLLFRDSELRKSLAIEAAEELAEEAGDLTGAEPVQD